MTDRKAELELKKAQLNAFREEKRRKEEQRKSAKLVNGNVDKPVDLRDQTEVMLKELGIEPVSEQPIVPKEPQVNGIASKRPNKLGQLRVVLTDEIDIAPQENVNYCKETQTITELSNISVREKDLSGGYYVPSFFEWDDGEILSPDLSNLNKQKQSSKAKNMHDSLHNGPGVEEFENLKEGPKIPTFTDAELNQRLLSDGFLRFFSRSTKVVERVLCVRNEEQLKSITPDLSKEGKAEGTQVVLNRQFFDEKWSTQRMISALDWSTAYPELLLAGYQANEQNPTEPGGVCLLWNMLFPTKASPEYIFHCPSPITSACLSRFHPNLVIAGTHSGMLVLWDTRSYRRVPVQKTQISQKAHGHPVFSVQVVGTQNAHNVVSLSSDGSLRAWTIDNFTQPVEASRVLECATSSGVHEISPTCMSFFANDVNNFALGADNNCAYTEQRHSRVERVIGSVDLLVLNMLVFISRSGGVRHDANRQLAYEGHSSPISSIHCHPSPGEVNFSNLFLTTSLDWTTRLWSVKERRPLYSFGECFECVYDAKWSPVHPAVFATADGNGRMNIWDLNRDFEAPVAKKRIGMHGDEDAFQAGRQQVSIMQENRREQVALSKLRWDNNGRMLAVGDVAGRVHIYSVGEDLAKPAPDAWTRLAKQLHEMKNTSIDASADSNANPHPISTAGSLFLGNAGLSTAN
ncbi:Cytoplasmic dynein 1 intermediate chain 2 [Cichlidogyrus casuarinus]|uniref:Cytoplasmic dynein 1 intermediate chain 2 n=1 Tax=Cichlidogyrus casuarinus TaxID=1844966 RepID=A0ABD2QMH2_9PLAT